MIKYGWKDLRNLMTLQFLFHTGDSYAGKTASSYGYKSMDNFPWMDSEHNTIYIISVFKHNTPWPVVPFTNMY